MTRGRYFVVVGLFILSLITYIDRVCISSAKGPIAADLGLSDEAMGIVFGAFALGYALGQVPSGMFADRFGPRLALSAVVIVWSAFTALTGAVRGFHTMVAVRFLFGVGEAGAFPGSARAIYNWLPIHERGRANGILFSGSRLGGALAFPILVWLEAAMGWRWAFVVLGAAGIVWAAIWWGLFRDHPAGAPPPPPRATAAVNWKAALHAPHIVPACVQYFASNFTFFICLSWMHPYLIRRFDLTAGEAAGYAMVPLLAGAGAQWTAGFFVDLLYRSGLRTWSRRLPAIAGFALAALGVWAVTLADSPRAAIVFFAFATFGADMTISPSWAFCADVGKESAATVSGFMNMWGNFGSFVSASVFPVLLDWTGSATAYFQLAALLNIAAIAAWTRMRSVASGLPS
ncbi:MAG: MFS transporter [Bryobacterales bacterium]|nr:MFS transporter [Bryobacterales bacterium]